MLETARQHGCVDAIARYGCEKVAFSVNWGALGQKFKPDFPSWPGKFKRLMVGEPGRFYDQLKNNKLFAQDGLLRNAFHPGDMSTGWGKLQAATMYGLPLYSLYQSAQAPAEMRGSAVGSMIGGTLGSIAGSPLGFLGQMGGNILGGQLGQTLGSNFNSKTVPQSHHPQVVAPPPQHVVDDHPPLSGQMAAVTGRPTQW